MRKQIEEAHLRLMSTLPVRTHRVVWEPEMTRARKPETTVRPKLTAAERARVWRSQNRERALATRRAYIDKNRAQVNQWFKDYRKRRREAGKPLK